MDICCQHFENIYVSIIHTCSRAKLSGPNCPLGQLGPGQLGPGAQLSAFWVRTVGPRTGVQLGPGAQLSGAQLSIFWGMLGFSKIQETPYIMMIPVVKFKIVKSG